MLLDRKEAELFFKLHCALMQYVVEQINPLDVHDAPVRYINLPPEKRRLVSIALASRLDLIDAFVADNPAKLSRKDLDLISTWRHMVCGQFVALRQLKHHMVFLACDGSPTAYAVMGLSDSLEEVIAAPLPALVDSATAVSRQNHLRWPHKQVECRFWVWRQAGLRGRLPRCKGKQPPREIVACHRTGPTARQFL